MTKLVLTMLAAAGMGLAGAPMAGASEDGFLKAIDSLNHYAIECPGCAEDALDVGRRVCAAFDSGGEAAAIQEVLLSYNGDDSPNRNYYATLFAQYSAVELCPEHNGEIGPI
ncbi:DUF732 domain-containing protein [Mycobacterium manitobense]|uniref:DUF732 domain-containing protein n=1 Tax=[Mycobacterium] manitobense TaxID=190147 RepID=A0A9X3BUP2_9MYCO|nr:DUF732 domain-containing protein [[Mycobacterium] manitobense]MCV7170928.1 DUF732 domain-containing protein [[Mycobacterium] manitobense]